MGRRVHYCHRGTGGILFIFILFIDILCTYVICERCRIVYHSYDRCCDADARRPLSLCVCECVLTYLHTHKHAIPHTDTHLFMHISSLCPLVKKSVKCSPGRRDPITLQSCSAVIRFIYFTEYHKFYCFYYWIDSSTFLCLLPKKRERKVSERR